ncbi:MAG: hypothetical protein SGARI_007467, partial [Bacillariaceae sp.]
MQNDKIYFKENDRDLKSWWRKRDDEKSEKSVLDLAKQGFVHQFKSKAGTMMDMMRSKFSEYSGKMVEGYEIATADDFAYLDPVDGSFAKNKGIRFVMSDGSRIIFRLSGTAGSGATIRKYIEAYKPEKIEAVASEALSGLVRIALDICDMKGFIGTEEPTIDHISSYRALPYYLFYACT